MNNYIRALILIVVAALAIWLIPYKSHAPQTPTPTPAGAITDFESCGKVYAIQETYPAQCRTPDGRLFVQDVTQAPAPEVVVDSPQLGELVHSPLDITGKAKGNWFFEANIPVTLQDENGKVLAQKGFMAQGDWMTLDYVNFAGQLTFAAPTTDYGVLIIQKDNPSGLPQNDQSFAIPVRFK